MLQDGTVKARAAYQDFVMLWTNDDPDNFHPEAGQSGVHEAVVASCCEAHGFGPNWTGVG
jgi:hypothetical protein